MSDHSHYGEYADARHDHEGDYAPSGHDHDLDYAWKYHRHDDEESLIAGLREDLGRAESDLRAELDAAYEAVRRLEEKLVAALDHIDLLDRLRPTCVVCHDAAATKQTSHGPACSDCIGDAS